MGNDGDFVKFAIKTANLVEIEGQFDIFYVHLDGALPPSERSRASQNTKIVIIKELKVSGYKNLLDCQIFPNNVHAITGCNGTGKSNLLEVLPFVVALHAASDEHRAFLLNSGACPNGRWFPVAKDKELLRPFSFFIETLLESGGENYIVQYTLTFEIKTVDEVFPAVNGSTFSTEYVRVKLQGAPGQPKIVLKRKGLEAVVTSGKTGRTKTHFKCRSDMSALHALDIREADDFSRIYPLLSDFRKAFLASEIVRLEPVRFRHDLSDIDRRPTPARPPGKIIQSLDPYAQLQTIMKDKSRWSDFLFLFKEAVGIDDVILIETDKEKASESSSEKYKHIILEQYNRMMSTSELSTGGSVMLAYLTILFTMLGNGGAAFFEEPENHLHPKAIADLIVIFREFGEEHTLMMTTHSPVVLNSLDPSEVTVMRPLGNGFVTTQSVTDIEDAIEALARGYVSFGDLLQNNYRTN